MSVLRKSPALAAAALLCAGLLAAPAWGAHHDTHHRGRQDRPLAACDDTALLFCEDFDALPDGPAQSPDWGTAAVDGTLTVEDAAGAGGPAGKDLHITTRGNGSAFLEVDGLAPPANSFWGRIRLRVDAFPTAPDWAHWTMVEATGQGPGLVRPLGGQYVPDVGANLWGVGSDGGPTGDWTAWQESAPAHAGTWNCVEWQLDASDNRVAVWIDGQAQPDLTVDTTHHGGSDADFVFPRFDTVKLGWQLYQAGPTPGGFDVRLDDIALSTERIGCDTGTGHGGH